MDSSRMGDFVQVFHKESFFSTFDHVESDKRPTICWLRDESKKFRPVKEFGWKPVRLCLEADYVEILDMTSKTLNVNKLKFGKDPVLTLTLNRSSCLRGHSLGSSLSTRANITCDYSGIQNLISVSNNDLPTEASWNESEPVQSFIRGTAKAAKNNHIVATARTIKVRIHYKAHLQGTVAADYGLESLTVTGTGITQLIIF